MNKSEIVIISAAPFEAQPLCEILKNSKIDFSYLSCGVGPLNSAHNSPQIAEQVRSKRVFFIGTCGSFLPNQELKLVGASSVHWLPTCERVGASYSIENLHKPFVFSEPLPIEQKIVLCSPNISFTTELPDAFDPKDCVENLELYSVAAEISAAAKSFQVLLCITNAIGNNAHTEWKKNFLPAAEKTAQKIMEFL